MLTYLGTSYIKGVPTKFGILTGRVRSVGETSFRNGAPYCSANIAAETDIGGCTTFVTLEGWYSRAYIIEKFERKQTVFAYGSVYEKTLENGNHFINMRAEMIILEEPIAASRRLEQSAKKLNRTQFDIEETKRVIKECEADSIARIMEAERNQIERLRGIEEAMRQGFVASEKQINTMLQDSIGQMKLAAQRLGVIATASVPTVTVSDLGTGTAILHTPTDEEIADADFNGADLEM